MKRFRALFALAPVALFASLLTACADGGSTTADGCLPDGEASRSIEVSGAFGEEIKLVSNTPITAEKLQRSVLIEGDGETVEEGDTVETRFTIINGTNGEVLSDEATDFVIDDQHLLPWSHRVLQCAELGDRLAAAAPVVEILGEGNASRMGLSEDDTLVIVLDLISVRDVQRPAPQCDALDPRDQKYPEVVLDESGQEPEITIEPCMEPPGELEIRVLQEGNGPVLVEGDQVKVNFVGVDWNGGARFDGQWGAGGTEFVLAEGSLPPGLRMGIVGQRVGSTVLVTVPPDLGFFDGVTRSYVIEIVSQAS